MNSMLTFLIIIPNGTFVMLFWKDKYHGFLNYKHAVKAKIDERIKYKRMQDKKERMNE